MIRRRRLLATTADTFLPSDLNNLTLWLDSSDASTLWQDSAATTPAGNGDVVGRWDDKSGNGFNFTQATTASKPLVSASGIDFDGTDDFLDGTGMSASSGAKTFYLVVDTVNAGTTDEQYIDIETGRLLLFHTNSSGNTGYFDTSYKNIAAATTGLQILTYALGGGTGTMYRNGTSLGSAAYVDRAIGAGVFMAQGIGGGGKIEAIFSEVIAYNSLHTTTERQQVESYLNDKWSVY